MSQILLEFDNKLEFKPIEIPLTSNISSDEGGYSNRYEVDQTSIYGILSPLIRVNSISVVMDDIKYFNLKSIKALPEVKMIIKDSSKLISTLNRPGCDNILQIQILPPFDNAYKKIQLNFYITELSVGPELITIVGKYKVPELFNSQYKCFGQLSTYDMFKQIAIDSKLGFATNTESSADERYIYCADTSYLELMDSEIKRSMSDATHIYDYWIDLWNNINYVDIYERYNTTDKDEDIMIWVSGDAEITDQGYEHTYVQAPANINNNRAVQNLDLFFTDFKVLTKMQSTMSTGSDKVYSIYEEGRGEYTDHLIQNGDIHRDTFTKYSYLGEVYGEYNYMLADKCRESYLQKMKTETLEVTLRRPTLALMRGSKVNFTNYINNDGYKYKLDAMKEIGMVDKDDDTEPGMGKNLETNTSTFIVDKTTSGQYLIIGQDLVFDGEWKYKLILTRPATNKTGLINKEFLNE